MYNGSLILRRGSTSDNFHQLASDDGLTGTVVDDLEFADHVPSVLGGVLHMSDQYQFSANRLLMVSTYVHGVAAR